MTLKTLALDLIDASDRLRPTRPDWVATFAEDLAAGEELPPIEVVAQEDGSYRLVTGAHRLAAHKAAGRTEITARVMDADAYAAESDCRLREIKENLVRVGLTELDRAVAIAAWKRIYEASEPLKKRGRPKAAENSAETALIFSSSFSKASARALGISERSVFIAVEIADGLDPAVRTRLAEHPIADRQSELRQLAAESPARQAKIADLLLADPPVGSVAEAIAEIDKTPAPAKAAAWEKVSSTFSKLPLREQHAFFTAHRHAIDAWLAAERARGSTTGR